MQGKGNRYNIMGPIASSLGSATPGKKSRWVLKCLCEYRETIHTEYLFFFCVFFFLSVAWPNGVQLLVFFCSSVPVVLFDTPGISRCRSQHVSVEYSSLLHHSIYV